MKQPTQTKMKNKPVFDETEMSEIYEAAWFALRHKFDEVSEYLDLSDEYLEKLKNKLDTILG